MSKLFFLSFALCAGLLHAEVLGFLEPVWGALSPIIISFSVKYPIIMTIIILIGASRLIFKPLMEGIRAYVKWTDTKSDDIILDKIESSIPYKLLCFFMDWAFSIKLKKEKM